MMMYEVDVYEGIVTKAVLIDFNACIITEDGEADGFIGTLGYIAPEMSTDAKGKHDNRVDTFSFGKTILKWMEYYKVADDELF